MESFLYLIVLPHLSIKLSVAPSYMPIEIWDLEELKHLQIMGSDLPDSGDNSLGDCFIAISSTAETVLQCLSRQKLGSGGVGISTTLLSSNRRH
ncbi:hypothetical protein ACS0TY_028919 [Phlomoides rotata]